MKTKSLNAEQFTELLKELNACKAAGEWAEGKTLTEVWETCHRADWLLWLAVMMADKPGWPSREQAILSTCDCAETALKFVPKGENRPRKAIQAARDFAGGRIDRWELADAGSAAVNAAWAGAGAGAESAAIAAESAIAAMSAVPNAWIAAETAVIAARIAARAGAVAGAGAAAGAAAWNAAAAGAAASKDMADIIRKRIPVPYKGKT